MADIIVRGIFDDDEPGFVPASGGGTSNFLRADGAWAAAGGGGSLSDGDKGDIVVSGTGTVWSFDSAVVTAAGRAILDDATAADQRTTLGAAAASHNHAASEITSGTIDTARLGSGTANSSSFLRGDQTWALGTGIFGQPFGGNISTPSAINGSTNDWDAFGGDATVSLVRASTTGASQDVTGITGGTAGRVCVIFNIGASGNLTFKRENTSSTAGNRITGPSGGGDFVINPGTGSAFWYDGTSERWRPIR